MMKLRGTRQVSSRVVVVMIVIVGLAMGYGLGYAQLQPQVNDLKASLAKTEEGLSATQANLDKTQLLLLATKANLTKSEAELKDTIQKLQSAKEELATTQTNLRSTTDQLKSLTGTLTQVKKLVSKLDKDRLLLIELRKDQPETRAATKDHWNNIKRVAANVDPVLGPSVDKIIVQIDAYFDWVNAMPGENATCEEILTWFLDDYYYVYGAYRYSDAVAAFQKEALLTIITHIDMANELLG